MNLTLSPQIKILALVGVLAIVGLLASMTLLGHSSSPSADSTPVRTTPRVTTAVTPPKSTTPSKPHATTTTPAKTATKHHAATTHKAHAATKTHVAQGYKVYATLPSALQWQLSQHGVVVVSTYDPNADVDKISANEAFAGATDAKAGFLLVSVLDNSVAGKLTALLPGGGLLPDPGVLVYKAPGNIIYRFDGFVDRDTVEQAAVNAMAGQVGVASSTDSTTTTTTPTP
ncbi:MAG: hypothetical protein ABUS54_04880 [Actinomycetota bacterium]